MNGRRIDSESATAPEVGENDRSFGNWEPRGKDPSIPPTDRKPGRFAEALKQLFRQVAKAIITDHPAPKPKRRRKRIEDTRGLFKKAMKKILLPVVRSLFDFEFLHHPPDELDETQRLIRRERNSHGDMRQSHEDHTFHYGQSNHLSPRL